MKGLVGAFNQEKALVGAFSVIVKTDCETEGSCLLSARYKITSYLRDELRGEFNLDSADYRQHRTEEQGNL